MMMSDESDDEGNTFEASGEDEHIQNMTDEDWVTNGREISNNTDLETVTITDGALNDHKMSFLFRGLTRSSSIEYLHLDNNQLSPVGVWRMVPFLQYANNLLELNLDNNNFQSEGLSMMLYALCNSSIKELSCSGCGIKSIDIDTDFFPNHLKVLNLDNNNINTDGCRRLSKLLQKEECALEDLYLDQNGICCDGVEILADAIQSNSSLTCLTLSNNKIKDDGVAALVASLQGNTKFKQLYLAKNDVSDQGKIMLLKLVVDISSINATLQSNHTLKTLEVGSRYDDGNEDEKGVKIQKLIDDAVRLNKWHKPEDAGRQKMRKIQLHRAKRAELADLQGVKHSLYSEIDTLYLPEVLSLINLHHGQKELFPALKSTIIRLLSMVDMKICIQKHKKQQEQRQYDKIEIPLDHTPTWQHILPPDYLKKRKEQRMKYGRFRRRFVLSLINLWEFTLAIESIDIYGQSPEEVIDRLRGPIENIAKDHIGRDGRKGAIFERGAGGEGIMPDDPSLKQATAGLNNEDGNNAGTGKWRIPLGAYQALFSYLTQKEEIVKGIPTEQLRAATLVREQQADKKEYPSVKSLLDREGTRKRKADSLFKDLLDANGIEIIAEIDELVRNEEEMLNVKDEDKNIDPDTSVGREALAPFGVVNSSTVSDSLTFSAAMQHIQDGSMQRMEGSVQCVAENISFRDIRYPAGKSLGLLMVSFGGRVCIKGFTTAQDADYQNLDRPQIGAIIVAVNEAVLPQNAHFNKVLEYMRKLIIQGPMTIVFAEDKEFMPWFKKVIIPRFDAQLKARAEARAQAQAQAQAQSSNAKNEVIDLLDD